MEFKDFKNKLFEEARKEGLAEFEIYFSNKESLSISIYKEEVEKYNLNKSFGVSFRAKIDGKMGYSYTEIIDEDAIKMLVENAKASALSIENDDPQFIYEGDKEYSKVESYYKELENIDAKKLIDLAIDMEKECKKYSDKVVNFAGCGISYVNVKYGLMNSKGLELTDKSNLLTAYVVPIIKIDNQKYDGFGYGKAKSVDELNPEKIAKQAIDEAMEKVGARSIKSNKYKTVIKNEAMVSLLQSFWSVFDADSAQKGISLLKDKEGEIIASDKITIIDNPLMKDGLASVGFDDEGVATFEKEVVENGKLKTLLYNLKTANKAGIKSTGNGFKSSYASPVSVGPTNFYLKNGEKDFKELLKEVKNGVIISEFSGLHAGANSITGDFSLAAKGFMIEDGKQTFPIEQITVSGNFFKLLKDVEEVCSDIKFPMSSFGSPSVLISELSIAGE
ncbi:TldD/PmbA family protein [Clostridium sp.]|uniref:TldD/PmbA family protein n=1 Tax=Clostridium sp. TaxID=1506 RepID=UPI002A91B65C|nr:TldD/PmbA family protein [Clostridium sp.]MDY6013242.1 TldD/PmbA family protein [Clostridium sp.]